MKLMNEYKAIADSIINSKEFLNLKNDVHHGSNKYDHCKRVSRLSFLMSKIFHGNSTNVIRAGLLHDFFVGGRKDNINNSYFNHPLTSACNAKKIFDINKEEEVIIKAHMYHLALIKSFFSKDRFDARDYLSKYKPQNKNSKIVCICDLLVSIYEFLVFKVKYCTCLYVLFLINFINY